MNRRYEPYFKLDNVREGAFWVANKLYGITFIELKDMPAYNPEVKAFEVKDADGSHLAVFYVDYHPRPGKRSGAWATRLRSTWVEDGTSIRPIVLNVCNFSRPSGDTPALLTLEEVETLFHEFGHGLHGILSRVNYRSLGATPTRLCGVAVANHGELGLRTGGAAALRPPLENRRGHPDGSRGENSARRPVQPGL